MSLDEAVATALSLGALGLIAWVVKRAALGERPVVASVRCWLLDSHDEQKLAQGGWRCRRCGYADADLGAISPMRTSYQADGVTRELRS